MFRKLKNIVSREEASAIDESVVTEYLLLGSLESKIQEGSTTNKLTDEAYKYIKSINYD